SSRPLALLAALLVGFLPIVIDAAARPDAVDRRGTGEFGADRKLTCLIFVYEVQKDSTIENDALVCRAEVLFCAVGDAAGRLAGKLVVDVDIETHAGEGFRLLLGGVESPPIGP